MADHAPRALLFRHHNSRVWWICWPSGRLGPRHQSTGYKSKRHAERLMGDLLKMDGPAPVAKVADADGRPDAPQALQDVLRWLAELSADSEAAHG